MRLPLLLASAAVVVAPSLVHAQVVAAASPVAPAVSAVRVTTPDSATRQMRTILRQLASAEEGYYVQHGTYTTDIAALGLFDLQGFQSGRTAWLAVSFAGGRAWSAEARHASLKGKTCVMYVGDPSGIPGGLPSTRADHKPAEQMGAPTCDAL